MAIINIEDMCGMREEEAFEILRALIRVQTSSCLLLVVYTRFVRFLEMAISG